MKSTILVIEDDKELQQALKETLLLAGHNVITADNADEGQQSLHTQLVEIVLSDINMPGRSGLQLLPTIQAECPGVPVVLMTAYGSIQDSVTAMQAGASDYLVKPFSNEQLLNTIEKFIGRRRQTSSSVADARQPKKSEVQTLLKQAKDLPVAEAASSKKLFELAQRIAVSDATVMISGESGTGKEVLARFIHERSRRFDAPFVAINCAAIPENMLEAMLFGHEKGAFTGALNSHAGKFEQANGGTLLLDEITEMDLGLQAKLLRVLQEQEVERLGGKKTIDLDVRVIATSNRNLQKSVAEGKFREDLFYRLSVFPLRWLPLRERPEDIAPLVQVLINSHGKKMGFASNELPTIDATALAALKAHTWPGNVRELDNLIQRALVLKEGTSITLADIGLTAITGDIENRVTPQLREGFHSLETTKTPTVDNADGGALRQRTLYADDDPMHATPQLSGAAPITKNILGDDLKQKEYEIILHALRENQGKRKKTAEFLGISARTLRYKMAQIRDSGINIEGMLST